MTDTHSHILFNIDDGSNNIEESIAILKEMAEVGFKHVILTPHYIEGTEYSVTNEEKDIRFALLEKRIKEENLDITIHLGNEIFLHNNLIASIEGAVPILLVISAAIMAIVAAISFYDAANESAEEKTERLANSLKSAQEAAKDSKKAYEDLKSSIESLNDSQNALDGLVEGTREFQEALIAANQEVLNLLETYP